MHFSFQQKQRVVSPILPSLPFVLILSLVVSFDLDLKLNYAFEPISRSCGLIDHRAFFTDPTKYPSTLCVFTAKRAPSGICLGAT